MIGVLGIKKRFGHTVALAGIDFGVNRGDCHVILGPSGCGKSTLLKIISGLETADQGECSINGTNVLNLPAGQRSTIYMSQQPLLFPNLTVRDNLAFGLLARKMDKALAHETAYALAKDLGIGDQLEKMPHQLSGGQQQRVNFGRSLIIKPDVLLLDEPFASLDQYTRREMQTLFKKVSRSHGITSIFVTHDLREALVMGDSWGVMHEGKITCYTDTKAFVVSQGTAVTDEIAFWNNLPTNAS